ncbi:MULTISPECIES: GDSL-type esterase/lipase family protein [Paenibacillus]|uniref:Lipolytic protein G-D-S-L family n=2 Tax=Paenibacillus lactis TaxID=228574 RepID=G4HFH3_9BACL|nr:GDSL-type esterase/lipase family protein [Paenibacillus lactis]EHB64490.1 lipolytic protein G-D-S-L family [Paenibacillus lactis 154]MBP1892813.1 lysophospholipase L1-like esterase [Paenibacillus lactis]HAF97205.1 lysophospholipase [Paenibacillus lactis]
MRTSSWIWRITACASALATIVLVIGFIYAWNDINYPQGEPLAAGSDSGSESPSAPGAVPGNGSGADQEEQAGKDEDTTTAQPLPDHLNVTAIGDSLAKGTGDNTGSGFVRRSIDQLNGDGRSAKLLANLAINGMTTEALLPKLDDKGIRYALQRANVIMLSIGGNDLFQNSGLLSEETDPDALEIDPVKLMALLPEASERLQSILQKLRAINPDARIIYVGLYHPFADLKELQIPGNIVVSTWNHSVMEIVNQDPNMTLVPTFDLFQHKLDAYLSSDHFHPNGAGYQAIADRIVQGLK